MAEIEKGKNKTRSGEREAETREKREGERERGEAEVPRSKVSVGPREIKNIKPICNPATMWLYIYNLTVAVLQIFVQPHYSWVAIFFLK